MTTRQRTYLVALDFDVDDVTTDQLVEAMLPAVLEHSTAGEAIDTGLFGADDHLVADVRGLRLLHPGTVAERVSTAIDHHGAYALDDDEQATLVAAIVAAIAGPRP